MARRIMIEFKKFQGRDLFYGGKIFPHSKEIERFVPTMFIHSNASPND